MTARAGRLPKAITTSAATASKTPPAMRLYIAVSFRATAFLAWVEVTHSSRCLCVMNMRVSVRRMASNISHVWYANIVTVIAIWETPSERSVSSARKCVRLEIPRRGGLIPIRRGSIAGIAIVAKINLAHTQGEADGSRQAATSARNAAGADIDRRKLSNIFHRPIARMLTGWRSPDAARPCPKIQGSSCQSPRTQRRCRAAASS